MQIALIATDTAPLIALAAADELDALLMPNVRVIVPDIVRHELVSEIDVPGAQDVLDWIRANEPRQVYVASTEEYEEGIVLGRMKRASVRHRGEQAALELLARQLTSGVEGAILLSDSVVFKRAQLIVRRPENVMVLSTAAYLKRLVSAPSVNALLQRFMTAGKPWL